MKKTVFAATILLAASLALTGCGAARQQMPIQTAPAVEAATVSVETTAVSTTAKATTALSTTVKTTATATATTAKATTTTAASTAAKKTTTAASTTVKPTTTAAVTTAAVSTETTAADTDAREEDAEAKALAYVGAGYRVAGVTEVAGQKGVLQISLVSEEDSADVVSLCAGEGFCITEDEFNGRSFSAQALYFAAKRDAEAKALAFVGDGASVILCTEMEGCEGTFKVGVAKRGCNSQIDFYIVGKTFVLSEADWAASNVPAADGQDVLADCIGRYSDGAASLFVTASGTDGAHITVSMANGPFETCVWTMTGTVTADGDTLTVTYTDAAKEVFQYTADGTLNDNAVVSTNGTGTVVLDGTAAVWTEAGANARTLARLAD